MLTPGQFGTLPDVPIPSAPRMTASHDEGRICSPVPKSFHSSGCTQAGCPCRFETSTPCGTQSGVVICSAW